MQQFGQTKAPLGVIYCTSMTRPDAALALAMLNILDNKREARNGGVAVVGAGLGSAMFADTVNRFYQAGGRPLDSNRLLPVGLAADGDLPPDVPMVKAALARKNEKGEPAYFRTVRKLSDTSEVSAMLRNAITAQAEKNSVMILSAPATQLARSLALPGTRDLAAFRVKALLVVEATGAAQDGLALRKVLADWPSPVVLCGRELGEALTFPGAAIETGYAWAPTHPVADAYRAAQAMPYDAPGWDLAAMLYAAHPEHFSLSEPGTIQVMEDGRCRFTANPEGQHRTLRVDEAKQAAIREAFVSYATAKPAVRAFPGRVPQDQQKTPPAPPPVKGQTP